MGNGKPCQDSAEQAKASRRVSPCASQPDELAYYGKRAQVAGVSTSAFIRQRLLEGMVAENVATLEARLVALLQQIQTASGGRSGAASDDLLLSVFTSEALLATVVQSQDPLALYRAQEAAKAKLKRLKAAAAAA
jgi:hypothetical protein